MSEFRTITKSSELRDAVLAYQREIALPGDAGEALRASIAYVQAWIATRESPDGPWLFVPAKFGGYVGLTAQSYAANHNQGLHGRDAERAIMGVRPMPRRLIGQADQQGELYQALMEFCARHGSRPNGRARLMTWGMPSPQETGGAADHPVCSAFVEARTTLAAALGVRPEAIDITIRG